MKLYEAFDVDEETPVQWLAVHPLRWQEHWGEPAIMFREVDDETQALADAAPAMLAALKHDYGGAAPDLPGLLEWAIRAIQQRQRPDFVNVIPDKLLLAVELLRAALALAESESAE